MRTHLRSLFVVAILACGVRPVFATPQLMDKVVFGNHTYVVEEIPMLGLWDYGEDSVGTGKQKPPKFDFVTTANNSGYQAEFEIRNSKFWLRQITGQIDGKPRKNEQIIPGERFPIVAKWFTGKIHLAIGEFGYDTQESTAVLIFHVEKGAIKRTAFAERLKRVGTWNGLSEPPIQDETKISIAGIGAVEFPPGKWLLERVANHPNHDIYMFEKEDARLERLSFQMFKGDWATSLNKHLDSISEGVVNGIPRGVLKKDEGGLPGSTEIIRPAVKINDQCLTATTVSTSDNADPWMNHVLVCNWMNGTMDPETWTRK